MVVYNNGGQQYETEPLGTGRERVLRVIAWPRVVPTAGRGATPNPISVLPDPKVDQNAGSILGYDRGHVLGLGLGGANQRYNVVPMYPGFNRRTWKNVETKIRSDLLFAYSGRNLKLMIDVGYDGDPDRWLPTTLHAKAEVDVFDKKGVKSRKVLDYGLKRQPDDIEVTPPPDFATASLLAKRQDEKEISKIIKDAADFLETTLDDPEAAAYLRENGHLPHAAKAAYPDDQDIRYYEYLDILGYANKIDPGTSLFVPNQVFLTQQRELILQANMARNGGVLKSDDPNDPVHKDPYKMGELDQRGTINAAEIDHIIPKVLGGSNFFSNARVVSWLLNNKEDRIKKISGLVNPRRIALPTRPTREPPEAQAEVVVSALLMRAEAPLSLPEIISQIVQEFSVDMDRKPTRQRWHEAVDGFLKAKVAEKEITLVGKDKYEPTSGYS